MSDIIEEYNKPKPKPKPFEVQIFYIKPDERVKLSKSVTYRITYEKYMTYQQWYKEIYRIDLGNPNDVKGSWLTIKEKLFESKFFAKRYYKKLKKRYEQ